MGLAESRSKIKFLTGLAWLFSFLFHPILLPTLLFGSLVRFSPVIFRPITDESLPALLLVIFISTFLMPLLILLSLFLLRKKNASLNQFFMASREDRIVPFLFTGVYYLTLTFVIFDQYNRMLYQLMLAMAVLVIVLSVVTIFWKISAHAMGMGGFLGLLLCVSYLFPTVQLLVPVVLVVIVSGIVLSSRLYLQSHNVAHVFAGYFAGIVVSMGAVYSGFFF